MQEKQKAHIARALCGDSVSSVVCWIISKPASRAVFIHHVNLCNSRVLYEQLSQSGSEAQFL